MTKILVSASTLMMIAGAASAGAPAAVPAPLAGAVGPIGLAVAAAGYGAYRYIKWQRSK